MAAASLDEHEVRVFRHREAHGVDVHAAFAADSIDCVELSKSRGTEKLLIRADKPFSLEGYPNMMQRQHHAPIGSADELNEAPMFEGLSMKLGWDIELPPEGTAFFSLSVHLE